MIERRSAPPFVLGDEAGSQGMAADFLRLQARPLSHALEDVGDAVTAQGALANATEAVDRTEDRPMRSVQID